MIINSSKQIRLLFNINEKNVCFKCSKKNICKFFEETPKKNTASPLDLQYVLHGMYLITNNRNEDLSPKQIGEEETLPLKTTNFVSNDIINRISNKEWNSANRIMELNLETFDGFPRLLYKGS